MQDWILATFGSQTSAELQHKPTSSQEDGLFEFCKAIVEATAGYSVAVKPNLAFFEAEGVEGWKAFQKLCDYVNSEYQSFYS